MVGCETLLVELERFLENNKKDFEKLYHDNSYAGYKGMCSKFSLHIESTRSEVNDLNESILSNTIDDPHILDIFKFQHTYRTILYHHLFILENLFKDKSSFLDKNNLHLLYKQRLVNGGFSNGEGNILHESMTEDILRVLKCSFLKEEEDICSMCD